MAYRSATIPARKWTGWKTYNSDSSGANENHLCPPSINCMINENGECETRLGYLDMAWDLGVDAPVRPFYHKKYDITMFVGGGKVQFVDHNKDDVVIDTGSTTTAGTTTRMAEYLGDIYYTNVTDGLKRGVFGKLNDASADSGDGDVTVDLDMAARLSVFSKTSGNIIIDGVSYAFNAVAVATGKITLNAVTLSQDHADNTVCFVEHDISAGIENFSKVLFWKERLHGMGFISNTNADQPNNTVMAGRFVVGQTTATGIEDIIDFTYGSGGSTRITIGKGGKLTNILGAKDFIHFFKEENSYNTASADITTTGASIGLTVPIERDELHGCLNEDSAISMGNNEIAYITNDKRIMTQRISFPSGAAISYPDEAFDSLLYLELPNMDDEQPLGMAFYYKAQKLAIFQIAIDGQWYWYIYDKKVGYDPRTGQSGAWQPPQLVVPTSGFFERNGVLYATDDASDNIYSIFTAFDDNGQPIECTMATAEFNVGASMIKKAGGEGKITQSTNIDLKCFVTNKVAGRRSGSEKIIYGADYEYGEDRSIGAVRVGGSSQAATSPYAEWLKDFDVYPQEGHKVQLQAHCVGDFFSLGSYFITRDHYSDTFQRSL